MNHENADKELFAAVGRPDLYAGCIVQHFKHVEDGIYISSSHFYMEKDEEKKLLSRMIPVEEQEA